MKKRHRLWRSVRDSAQARDYQRCAQKTLKTVATQYRGSIEARAAETLLQSPDRSAAR